MDLKREGKWVWTFWKDSLSKRAGGGGKMVGTALTWQCIYFSPGMAEHACVGRKSGENCRAYRQKIAC